MYSEQELRIVLGSSKVFIEALQANMEAFPNLQPTAIGKIMDEYRSRILEQLGIL